MIIYNGEQTINNGSSGTFSVPITDKRISGIFITWLTSTDNPVETGAYDSFSVQIFQNISGTDELIDLATISCETMPDCNLFYKLLSFSGTLKITIKNLIATPVKFCVLITGKE